MDSYYGYKLLALMIVLGLNSYFSAVETALVSVRVSRLRQLAEEGRSGAQSALNLLANPERMLSVGQVGITLASLAMGWVGEETIHAMLVDLLRPFITPATDLLLHVVSVAIAFSLMTFLHVVIGEVVPKNLALEQPDKVSCLMAPSLAVFGRLVAPLVAVIERTSAMISRWLGATGETSGGGHSVEELKYIISSSTREGVLSAWEEGALRRLMEVRGVSVREVMVPRGRLETVAVDAGIDEVLKRMSESGYSRLPVYEEQPEKLIGIVHVKDVLEYWRSRRQSNLSRARFPHFDLRRILRKAPVVPETKRLTELMADLQAEHAQVAFVVDEFGTIGGLVSMEDVIEQVFGEIEDEFDLRQSETPEGGSPDIEVEGATPIRDLEAQYGIELPVEDGYETLAGFLMFRLERVPKEGDRVTEDDRRFTVVEMDFNRVRSVRIEKLELREEPGR